VGLFHGHTWPAPELLGCRSLIMGHVHPTVAFRDPIGFRVTRQAWVKAPCDSRRLARLVLKNLNVRVDKDPVETLKDRFNVKLRTSELFVMPAFNEFLGGQPMNQKHPGGVSGYSMFISPLLRSKSVDAQAAELYLLDGTFLGSISQLTALS